MAHFAEFVTVYDERFAHCYGYWRSVIAEVVEKYLACGTSTASPARAVVRAGTLEDEMEALAEALDEKYHERGERADRRRERRSGR